MVRIGVASSDVSGRNTECRHAGQAENQHGHPVTGPEAPALAAPGRERPLR